jgi:hypothetical protein
MTDCIAGKKKGISSLQRTIGTLSNEGLVGSRNTSVKLHQRLGCTIERKVISYHLKDERWFDAFLLFFSNDASLEDNWMEWQQSSPVNSSPSPFRQQKRFEFLNSDYGRKVVNKNYSDMVARVTARWWDLLWHEYMHEFHSDDSHIYSALDTYAAKQRTSMLALNSLLKVRRIGKFSKKLLRIPRCVVKKSDEKSDEEMKILTTLIRLSPSAVEYIMRQDSGNEVVPSFILDFKRFTNDCLEQNLPPADIPRRVVMQLGGSFRKVLLIMLAHDTMTLPPELVSKACDVEDQRLLESLLSQESLGLPLRNPSSK